MSDRTPTPPARPSDSFDPIPYLQGFHHVIGQQRIDYILSRTTKRQKRQRRLTDSSVAWLVIAMSLFANLSIPMVWRRLHPSTDQPEPDQSAFTKARG